MPVFAWLLVAQSLLLPLAKVRAAEATGAGYALAVLCSTTLPHSGEGDEPEGKRIHDLGCCLVCSRFVLDAPIAVLTRFPAMPAPEQALHPAPHALPQSRAPPAITATPLQSRAPPSFA